MYFIVCELPMGLYLIKLLLFLNFFTTLWWEFNKIAHTNRLKNEADVAFHRKAYQEAANIYDSLLTHFGLKEEKLRLNYAHALFKKGDRKKAFTEYEKLTGSEDIKVASNAFQQLGLIMVLRGKNEKALGYFKEALKTDPLNEQARFNYELLKKLDRQQIEWEQENTKSTRQDQEASGEGKGEKEREVQRIADHGEGQTHKGAREKGGELKEESESGRERKGRSSSGKNAESRELRRNNMGNKEEETYRIRLSEIQISEEKARFLLEEMRNEEVQFLQQLRKKQRSHTYKGPDW